MRRTSQSTLTILVKKCRQGDKKAWAKLVDIISPIIFSICRKMKLSREESFDIFGQVCYLLLENIDNIKAAEKVVPYVATITRREVYALYRKSRVYEYFDDRELEDITGERTTEPLNPDKLYEMTRRDEELMQALLLLPEREYKLLRMLFLDRSEPSYRETAEKLNIPVSSIGPTRARGLDRLYRILKKKRFDF